MKSSHPDYNQLAHYSFVVEPNLDKGRPMHKCVVSPSATIITVICIQDYAHNLNQLYLRFELRKM